MVCVKRGYKFWPRHPAWPNTRQINRPKRKRPPLYGTWYRKWQISTFVDKYFSPVYPCEPKLFQIFGNILESHLVCQFPSPQIKQPRLVLLKLNVYVRTSRLKQCQSWSNGKLLKLFFSSFSNVHRPFNPYNWVIKSRRLFSTFYPFIR